MTRPLSRPHTGETSMAMDVVDYEIFGTDMQYVEVELDPGEAAVGEAGAMMYMQAGIEMD
ncbi:MAG: AIM24 family protein, partial [Rhodocyclaceae bacterium]|nr:AIM24 family protein [Rhodocyclaceae bacterium]